MARFVLRFRGNEIEEAKSELAAIEGLVVVEASGRTFLVEAEPEQVRSMIGDAKRWVASAETQTPPPRPPRPAVRKPGSM